MKKGTRRVIISKDVIFNEINHSHDSFLSTKRANDNKDPFIDNTLFCSITSIQPTYLQIQPNQI